MKILAGKGLTDILESSDAPSVYSTATMSYTVNLALHMHLYKEKHVIDIDVDTISSLTNLSPPTDPTR